MNNMDRKRLLGYLTAVCEEIAEGRYKEAKELFDLTREDKYPEMVARIAEAFGMMLVGVEAREYRLEQVNDNLMKAQAELAAAMERLSTENVILKQNLREQFSPSAIRGTSDPMKRLLGMIEKISHISSNILISGETGTGKELVAKAIHFHSIRGDKPFVAINCSAIPEQIFESEIFGIEKGVATGVDKRIGKIEQAHGGSLFLDEIADMPASCQAKMLRVLEEDRIERVGGRKPIPVDVRIIAASNKDLKAAVERGEFRDDLFYRLNVINLTIPPLRERGGDIRLLASHFLNQCTMRLGRQPMQFSSEAMERLLSYTWPGNVRELENEIERAAVLSPSRMITVDDLSETLCSQSEYRENEKVEGTILSVRETEMELIRNALADTGGNRTRAAQLLGISREGLRKKMKRHGLP
ncbi:MAG: sigma-54 interaction domain-containing protein [Syntrophobacteraceae bacterium]